MKDRYPNDPNRIEKDAMGQVRGQSGKRETSEEISEADQQARADREQARTLDRQPDETDEQYHIRMEKVKRSKMGGVEQMEYDQTRAKLDREERTAARLKAEPDLVAQITATNSVSRRVTIRFDITHPYAPNQTGEVEVNRVEQAQPDGGTRLLPDPVVGMRGVVKSSCNGVDIYRCFIADAKQGDLSIDAIVQPQQAVVKAPPVEVTVVSVNGSHAGVYVVFDNDATVQVHPDAVPEKGAKITIQQGDDGNWQLVKDSDTHGGEPADNQSGPGPKRGGREGDHADTSGA